MSSKDPINIKTLVEYAHGFLISKTLFASCELGIYDVLSQSEVPLSAASVAEHLGMNIRGTERLLSACVGLKLLEMDIKDGEVSYRNSDLSRLYLTKTSPKSVYHTLHFFSNEVYPVSNYLTDAVRQGQCQYEKAFGLPSQEIFDQLFRSEDKLTGFIQAMDSYWHFCGKEEVISAFDLSPFNTICDLGGGIGTLAKAFSSMYRGSSIIVYDLPVVAQATQKLSLQEEHICYQQGDFFKDPLPEADLYILSRIMHDWSDDKCLQILKKIYKMCKPGGGVFIVEAILNEDMSGPLVSQMQGIMMLLLTEGKERTAPQYKNLLQCVGFKDIQFSIKGNLCEAILALK